MSQPENIAVSVSRDHDSGDVVVQFGELVKVINLPPDQARQLAKLLLLAAQAETVKTEASAPAAPPSPAA